LTGKSTDDHPAPAVAIGHQAALAVEETRYHQAMVQAERLAAVGQTIAALSHHIKNILQGLRSGSEILKMGLTDKDENLLQKGWNIVEKNQGKIYDLVMDMLSYSKEREPAIENTDINRIVRDVLELLGGRMKEMNVKLETRLAEDLPMVPADPEGLHRALLNIVSNALDAVEERKAPAVAVATVLEGDGEWVRILVLDNGIGIPPKKLPDIFRPFVSTKGARGTGLGLAVSRKILREHGGDILVQSQPGKGGNFFFEGFELGASRLASPALDARRQTGIVLLIHAYRDLGHFVAHLDPLGEPRQTHALLELHQFGLDDTDLDSTFETSPFIGLPQATLRQLLAALRETYCRTIGVEYMHIQDTNIRRWLQERMEPRRNQPNFDRDKKLRILKELHYAELFERFLQTRFVGQKRFSLEGAETLIPLLDAIVENAAEARVCEIILGMTHRGRLNVLANTLRKPYQELFAEFEENYLPDSRDGDGDVKYHLGFSSDRVSSSGARIHLSLSPNPSHLEAVDPVVEGRTRAKQFLFGDEEGKLGIPVLIHGDA